MFVDCTAAAANDPYGGEFRRLTLEPCQEEHQMTLFIDYGALIPYGMF